MLKPLLREGSNDAGSWSRSAAKIAAVILAIVLLGGAGYWISIHKHEEDDFIRRAQDSMTEFDESSPEVAQELPGFVDALKEELHMLAYSVKEEASKQDDEVHGLQQELAAVRQGNAAAVVAADAAIPEEMSQHEGQEQEPQAVAEVMWSREELCRDAQDVKVVRGPDELQEWEIPAHIAMQLNSLPPGLGRKLVCRDAMDSPWLRQDAALCPRKDSTKRPAALERDFLSSKRRHLASDCSSRCLYSASFRSVAYAWSEPEPNGPSGGGCYMRVGADHECLATLAEEHRAVLQWIRWDGCHDLVSLRKGGEQPGLDLDHLEISQKQNFTASQPVRDPKEEPEYPEDANANASGSNVSPAEGVDIYTDRRRRRSRKVQPSVRGDAPFEKQVQHHDYLAGANEWEGEVAAEQSDRQQGAMTIRKSFHPRNHHAASLAAAAMGEGEE